MASLSLKHINKTYPNGFEAVKDFNLEIEDKEFIIFVGPSGCGKSARLRPQTVRCVRLPNAEYRLYFRQSEA